MRIALVNPVLSEGGAARATVHMANYWATAGHDVCLFSFEAANTEPFFPLHPDVRLSNLALEGRSPNWLAGARNNLRRLRRLRSALRQADPDVALSFIDSGNVRAIIASLFSGIPLVVSERVHPAHAPISRLWRLLRRLTYTLADALVVQTAEIERYVLAWGTRRVRVIPNPVVAPPNLEEAPRLPKPYVLAIGRLQPQKSFDMLIDAFARVAADQPDWTLAIAGEGPLEAALTEQAQALRLGSRIHLLGAQRDIGGLLERADIFVLSSAFEGFPNALCEAMASGVASIATDCPSGPSDIVIDNENGLLIDNADEAALARALGQLMADPNLRQRLGQAATRVTDTFALKPVMAKWDRLIAEVLA